MNKKHSIETQITRAATWVTELKFEDIPQSVTALAKLQIVDVLASICAGSRTAAGNQIFEAILKSGAKGTCTTIPYAQELSLLDTVYLHSALANSLELDNVVFVGHVGQSAVTVPISLAQSTKCDMKTMLLAQIAAVEIAGRMGAYFAIGPLHGHMRSYLHRTAGAVAAAKILNLSCEETSRAISIALSMPEFPLYPAAFSPDTKILCTSSPSVEGIRSAFLAQQGFDAAQDILEHPAGFWNFFSHLKTPPDVWAHLGNTWSLYALSCKTYSSCAYAQGPVAAVIQLLDGKTLDQAIIDHVVVHAPVTTATMESLSTPHLGAGVTTVNTNFSTKRSVAAALLYGELNGDFFSSENFESKKENIELLSGKIELKKDFQLSLDLIRGFDDALHGAGKPGVFGMSQTQNTFDKLKEIFGSQSLITLSDIPSILKLPGKDLLYFIRRFLIGYRSRLPFFTRASRRNYVSYEKDLSKFSFRQSGRVEVYLKNGTLLKAECRIPPGFAGDPERTSNVEKKFIREAMSICGKEKANEILAMINSLPQTNIIDMLKNLKNEK